MIYCISFTKPSWKESNPNESISHESRCYLETPLLWISRVVQTQAIFFLKSMLKRAESDIESTEDDVIEIQSRSKSDPPLSDIDFKNKMDCP